jgi:hypothetical protein
MIRWGFESGSYLTHEHEKLAFISSCGVFESVQFARAAGALVDVAALTAPVAGFRYRGPNLKFISTITGRTAG